MTNGYHVVRWRGSCGRRGARSILRRFILLGIYTGSRSSVILGLTWAQIDLERGVMLRQPKGEIEQQTKRTPPVRLGRRILAHLRHWWRRQGQVGSLCLSL